jgi:hypothetical protein
MNYMHESSVIIRVCTPQPIDDMSQGGRAGMISGKFTGTGGPAARHIRQARTATVLGMIPADTPQAFAFSGVTGSGNSPGPFMERMGSGLRPKADSLLSPFRGRAVRGVGTLDSIGLRQLFVRCRQKKVSDSSQIIDFAGLRQLFRSCT